MARPPKKGLDYFPLDVDVFDDDKVIDLSNEFGPLGEVVYLRILCLIYRNGYYYRFQSLDKLASLLLKSIGNRWVRDKSLILQVIPYLAECNLLSSELMQDNVLTSASIQRRYLNVAKNQRWSREVTIYNLLGDNAHDGVIIAQKNGINDTKTPVNDTKTPVNVAFEYTKEKERKEKESKAESGDAAPLDAHHDDFVFSLYAKMIGRVSETAKRDMRRYLEIMDAQCIQYAIEEAAQKGGGNHRYMLSILKRLESQGITTADAIYMNARIGVKSRALYEYEKDIDDYVNYFKPEAQSADPPALPRVEVEMEEL